jgi:hypothetical protein
MTNTHILLPERDDDEDLVDFINRAYDAAHQVPPPAGFGRFDCPEGQHWPTYYVDTDGLLDPPYNCPGCNYSRARAEADRWQCRATHRRWQTWRWVGRLHSWLYSLGAIGGCCTSYNGCEAHPVRYHITRWGGRRSYILGWRRENWRCLLRYRHWPGVHVGFGYCGKCVPCPSCDSTTNNHEPRCSL